MASFIALLCLTIRSSRDRFAARLMRYRVAQRRAANRSGLTQVLARPKDFQEWSVHQSAMSVRVGPRELASLRLKVDFGDSCGHCHVCSPTFGQIIATRSGQ